MLAINTLMFSGFGDDVTYRFIQPDVWADLGQPASAPSAGAGGCTGLTTFSTGGVAHIGGTFSGATKLNQTLLSDLALSVQMVVTNGNRVTNGSGIAADGHGYIYYINQYWSGGVPTGTYGLVRMQVGSTNTAVVVATITYAAFAGKQPSVLGVNQAGTVGYYTAWNDTTAGHTLTVYRVDLGTGAITTFKTAHVDTSGANISTILVLPDDTVVIGWGARTDVGVPCRYATDGTLLNTYNALPDTYSLATWATLAYDSNGVADPSAFFLSYYSAAAGYGVTVAKIEAASGSVLGTTWATPSGGFKWDGPFTALNAVVDPVPTGELFLSRRLRRFPLPFDRSFYVYLSRLEFLIQSGEGLTAGSGQGTDPKMEVRFSPDGGRTWGNWIQIGAGRIGEYNLQSVVNRIGKLRNGVCEVAVSDPIFWYFLQSYATADEQGGV